MTPDPRPALTAWRQDVYSQGGEDGMVAECLRRLRIDVGVCVEVGAHDGFTYSNTARLWHDLGWRAVLIEPDPARHRRLTARADGLRCTTIQRVVGASGPSRLTVLLDDAGAAREIDVLSIDVDGDDLAILRGSPEVTARVLLCEYNPTIPAHLTIEGEPGTPTGSSFAAVVAGGHALGYALVGATGTNAIFVRAEDVAAFDDLERLPEAVMPTTSLAYVVTDYRGRAVVVGGLPFRYRPGRPSFVSPPSEARADVRVRWTARGAAGTVVWKVANVLRRLGSPRDAVAELRARTVGR